MHGTAIPFLDMGGCSIKLNDDGSFNMLVGATDLGTGADTVLGQIAAEVLGGRSSSTTWPYIASAASRSPIACQASAIGRKTSARSMPSVVKRGSAGLLPLHTPEIEECRRC